MIVVSLLLFLAGVALLVAGLVAESISLEVASIVSALLSALVLYLGVRQRPPLSEPLPSDGPENDREPAARIPPPAAGEDLRPGRAQAAERGSGATVLVPQEQEVPPAASGATVLVPDPVGEPAGPAGLSALLQGPEPAAAVPQLAVARQYPDEPDEEPVRAADVEWISAQPDVVQVVDGHPRYHVGPCPSLRDQEIFAMPVSEAREAGFTPCGRCRPDATILDSAWRAHLNRGDR